MQLHGEALWALLPSATTGGSGRTFMKALVRGRDRSRRRTRPRSPRTSPTRPAARRR